LLIDARQKPWMAWTFALGAASVAAYAALSWRAGRPLTGGTTAGLWFGIAGSALMIYAGLLAAHRHVPQWWPIGTRATWLKGHVWLGLLSGLLIVLHSGFRWGGPLERALWVVLIGVLATGVVGLALQNPLPRLLTRRIAAEAPPDQVPHLCALIRRRADALADEVCGPHDGPAPAVAERARVRAFYEAGVRPFLADRYPHRSPLHDARRAEAQFAEVRFLGLDPTAVACLDELEALCNERRALAEQERLHRALHGWLLVHVPLSVLLLVLGLLHAIMSVYY
jgi:hypothetical protein